MSTRAAVFCNNALGDGIVSLTLSHNLSLNGWQVDTYQNSLPPLQSWVPHLPILKYPPASAGPALLDQYDWFFIFQDDSSPLLRTLIEEGKRRFPDRVRVLYAIPSRHVVRERYYADAELNPQIPLAKSLQLFCARKLHLPYTALSNGFTPPADLIYRRHPRRVILHPTSGNPNKNWPKERYVKLALHLQRLGYEPIIVVGNQREGWDTIQEFATLDDLARYFYESGYFIGNDSGLGHIASSLGIPTVTIARRRTAAKLWAPSFAPGSIVAPPDWIPNIRGFRLRDRKWSWFVPLHSVTRAFDRLVATWQISQPNFGSSPQTAHRT